MRLVSSRTAPIASPASAASEPKPGPDPLDPPDVLPSSVLVFASPAVIDPSSVAVTPIVVVADVSPTVVLARVLSVVFVVPFGEVAGVMVVVVVSGVKDLVFGVDAVEVPVVVVVVVVADSFSAVTLSPLRSGSFDERIRWTAPVVPSPGFSDDSA